jgi:hypothetical protein
MITDLVQNYTPGSGTLVTRHAILIAGKVTVVSRSALRHTTIIDSKKVVTFNVSSVSSTTATIDSIDSGVDQAFYIGDVVIQGEDLASIRDSSIRPGQQVYTSDRYSNPDFITSLDSSKISNLSEGSDYSSVGANSFATGTNSVATGSQSIAMGSGVLASGNQCYAEGKNTIAGYIPVTCSIDGTTITIPDVDLTNDFYVYEGSNLCLTSLSGGTGETSQIAEVTDVVFNDPDTIITVADSISHTTGKANMDDFCEQAHAEGADTVASTTYAHAEGKLTVASGWASHAEGSHSIASGRFSHAEGRITLASGECSHSQGHNTIAEGETSFALGLYSKTTLYGQVAHAAGRFTFAGDAQSSTLILMKQTTDATPTNLSIKGENILYITIPTNRTVGFTVDLVARGPSIGAYFVRKGLITNNSDTTELLGSVGTLGTDINASALAVSITANDTNNTLNIQVTGLEATTINWVARVNLVEVG